jgi:hypothetical protein
MSIYLIDFENVHYDGLSGILNLNEDDEVYIFYSDNGKRLTFELHEQIMQSRAKFYYYKAAVGGKNALDHQLSTYLGFLVGKKEDIKKYYIVSKDQGFRHLMTFWKSANLGLEMNLVDSIKISRQNHNGGMVEEPAAPRPRENTPPLDVPIKRKGDSESPLAKLLASRRKSRDAKVKPEQAPPATVPAFIEPTPAPVPQPARQPVPQQEVKPITPVAPQPAPQPEATPVTAAKPMPAAQVEHPTLSRGFSTDSKTLSEAKPAPEAAAKIPPKVIEFVLPQEVVAAGKSRFAADPLEMKPTFNPEFHPANVPEVKPDLKPEAMQEVKAAAKPETVATEQTAAVLPSSSSSDKPAKTQPARRSRAKKSEPVKIVKAEPAEPVKTKPLYQEEDIVKLIPEAADKPWLGDIVRYLNSSSGKADLYNMIRRRLGQEAGRNIYNQLKKLT